jgi:hypothetical protein
MLYTRTCLLYIANLRMNVVTVLTIKVRVFWAVTPCIVVDVYQLNGAASCLHIFHFYLVGTR